MKRLYKATYTAVILVEPEESLEFARSLYEDTLGYLAESLNEVNSAEDLPVGWKASYYPIYSTDGALADDAIQDILEKYKDVYSISEENRKLKQRIEELEQQLAAK